MVTHFTGETGYDWAMPTWVSPLFEEAMCRIVGWKYRVFILVSESIAAFLHPLYHDEFAYRPPTPFGPFTNLTVYWITVAPLHLACQALPFFEAVTLHSWFNLTAIGTAHMLSRTDVDKVDRSIYWVMGFWIRDLAVSAAVFAFAPVLAIATRADAYFFSM
jgi:hypothetical protein